MAEARYSSSMSGAFVRSVGALVAPSGPASRAVAAALRRAGRLVRPVARAAPAELELPDSVAWSARVRRGGATVRCAAGSVWLTREGDPEDRVLEAGQVFRSEKPGRIAVLALGPARLVVCGDLGR
jgi:hypothetical protein